MQKIWKTMPATVIMQKSLIAASMMFFVSGACGLIYQVAWVKLLTLHFGSSAWSVSTVVSSFMAGLGLGSWWAGRKLLTQRPFLVYAWLEIAIAIFGLVSLPILAHVDALISPIYQILQNHFLSFVAVRFMLCFLILLVPTFLMGASLPILVVGLTTVHNLQKIVAVLYGINTLGAACGVIVAGFWLLPAIGLNACLSVAAIIGTSVGGLAFVWDRFYRHPVEASSPSIAKKSPWLYLGVTFVSGLVGLFCQICWTRLLAPIVGSSTYAFSVIVATFLLGSGIGGLVASSNRIGKFGLRNIMVVLLICAAITITGGLFVVNYLPAFFVYLVRICNGKLWLLFPIQGIVSGALVFFPICFLGTILPLAVVGYREKTGMTGAAVGGIYAANTLGAILGSLSAGFLCIPWLGVYASFVIAIISLLIVAVFLIIDHDQIPLYRRCLWNIGALLPLAILVMANPHIDFSTINAGYFRAILKRQAAKAVEGDLLFVQDGLTATITVYRSADATRCKTNGKTDASTGDDMLTQYLLGHLPMFMNLDAQRVCVVGLGSGATARAVATHPVTDIDVIELEPAVVKACKYFSAINDDVLADKRLKLYLEDARTFLRYRHQKYDVIISEPSNPWICGVSALFTTEHYQTVRNRLAVRGIFCQWIQRYELSQETLSVMLATLADIFPYVTIFDVKSDLICLASNHPLQSNPQRCRQRLQLSEVRTTLQRVHITNIYELFHGFLAAFPENALGMKTNIRNNDDNLWLEYRAPLEMYQDPPPIPTIVPDGQRYLRQIADKFFAKTALPEIIYNLSHAIKNLSPEKASIIEAWLVLLKDPKIKKEVAVIKLQAQKNWALIRNIDRYVARASNLIPSKPLQAIRILKKLLRLKIKQGKIYRLLGEAYFSLSQIEQAIFAYRQAITINSNDFISQANMGILLYMQKRPDEGAHHFQKSISSNPYYHRARAMWFTLLVRQQQMQKAKHLLREAQTKLTTQQYKEFAKILRTIAGHDIQNSF